MSQMLMEAPEIKDEMPYNAEENPYDEIFVEHLNSRLPFIKASCVNLWPSHAPKRWLSRCQCLLQGVDPSKSEMIHDCSCVSAQICFINSARAREGTTPNATLIQAHVNGVPVLVVVQIRDLKADEEILVHYGQQYWRWLNDKVVLFGAWSWS